MFCKILLCVDDSPVSDQIGKVGADLARRYSAEVVVLSVLDPSRFASPPYSGLEAMSLVDRYSRSLAHVGQRVRASLEGAGIATRMLVLPGRTAETVIEVAQQEQADLIVMGGETKGRLRALVEGSLWADVARAAPCNVLRVSPAEGDQSPEPPKKDRNSGTLIPLGLRPLAVDPLAS
jgi:nucleotide-binding universal stress UspA family protein